MPEFWNQELFKLGDTAIHTAGLVKILLIVTIGLWVRSYFSRYVSKKMETNKSFPIHTAKVIQKMTSYLILIVVAFTCLDLAGIPLSTFGFLGGAFAIGIGFGAQNLLNNFISGIILMLEHPLRTGDFVQVESNLGTIAEIGARSTRLLRNDGVDVLVPNSKLLENTVINWTLNDDPFRYEIKVGVSYDSDPRQVEQTISEAIQANKSILQTPKPTILFENFGDNSLDFCILFWSHVKSQLEVRRIASEIRYDLFKRFKEKNIVIAYPQRDIHIDFKDNIQGFQINKP